MNSDKNINPLAIQRSYPIETSTNEKSKTSKQKETHKTHDINQIALLLQKYAVSSPTDLEKKIPNLLKDYLKQLDPNKRRTLKAKKVAKLFEVAFLDM